MYHLPNPSVYRLLPHLQLQVFLLLFSHTFFATDPAIGGKHNSYATTEFGQRPETTFCHPRFN